MVWGHTNKAPATIMYESIMSRKTVRKDLIIIILNYLEVKLTVIMNIYLQLPVTEKVWTTLDLDFNKGAGKTAVIEHYMA